MSYLTQIFRHKVQSHLKPKEGIKNIIAIGSGKGGVGKSTVSVNVAVALVQMGYSVGLLDADIYGPSQPLLLGLSEKPQVRNNKFIPLQNYGLSLMSMGSLVEKNTPMIWRGPMVSGALLQLLNETNWPELDFLILDLPPGTGDIQLTMAQKIPMSGSLVVTTPQDLALMDARKAIEMFNKVSVPVLGLVENMSVHICKNCGHAESIFGEGGGERLAAHFEVPLLAQVPLVHAIRAHCDNGNPIVNAEPNSDQALIFKQIAQKMVENLSIRPKDYTLTTPVVSKT
jgi:ATP-binding protein involved in chromosome partitioning